MGGEDSDKIVRDTGDTLTIKLSADEEKYRAKYLPDPKNLTDEKLVCTVCSVSLANDVHRGKTVHVHRALKVLVCEACFTFYGDGCFSTDEDGDDKYCRWCGQGGTLFLCSACNCAFCQKCVKQNLKASVLADLEKDDWKCYFCNPRPLFGCRTICWGAQELNKIGIEKEKEKLRKQRERLEKMEERKKEGSLKLKKKDSSSEDEQSTTKRRKSRAKSSSPEVMHTKRTRSSVASGHMNGSIDRSKKKRRDSSSDSENSDNRKDTNRSRSRNAKSKKYAESSSEDESDVKSKIKLKKKKPKNSDESSEEDGKKSKRRSVKKKTDTSDDESSDEKPVKRKRPSRKKKNETGSSSDNKPKKKRQRRKQRDTSSDEESNDDRKKKPTRKKKHKESSGEDSDNETKRDKKRGLESRKTNEESDNEPKKENKKHNLDKYVNDEKIDIKLKLNEGHVDNALMKKRIKLAVLWLSGTVKDISELGTLISIRASKFGKKKINTENLKTYDDVLTAVSKLKQLISGIHSNYDHIEKGLDAHLKPWKVLTGLEEPEAEKTVEADVSINTSTATSNVVEEVPNVEASDKSKVDVSLNSSTVVESNKGEETNENDMVLQWSGLSADEDSGDENSSTKALISKANETLNKEENEEAETIVKETNNDGVIKTEEEDITKTEDAMSDETTPNESEMSQSLLCNNDADEQDNPEHTENVSNKEVTSEDAQKTEDGKTSTEKQQHDSETDMFEEKESSEEANSANVKDCPDNKSEEKEILESSSTETKRKSELKGKKTAHRKNLDVKESSGEDTFETFSRKLKNKWQQKDNMKLKASLGIDSSGDSDEELEGKNNKVLKKRPGVEEPKKELGLKSEDKCQENDKNERHIKGVQAESQSKKEKQKEKVKNSSKYKKQLKEDRKNTLTSDDSEGEDIQKDKKHKKTQNTEKNDDSVSKSQRKESNDRDKNNKTEEDSHKIKKLKQDKKNEMKDKIHSEDENKKAINNGKAKEKEKLLENINHDKKGNKDSKHSRREKEEKKKGLSCNDSVVEDKQSKRAKGDKKKGLSSDDSGVEDKQSKRAKGDKKKALPCNESDVEVKQSKRSKVDEKKGLSSNDSVVEDKQSKRAKEDKKKGLSNDDSNVEDKQCKRAKGVKKDALPCNDSDVEDKPSKRSKGDKKKESSRDNSGVEDTQKNCQKENNIKTKKVDISDSKSKKKNEHETNKLNNEGRSKNNKRKEDKKVNEKVVKNNTLLSDDSEIEDSHQELKETTKLQNNDISEKKKKNENRNKILKKGHYKENKGKDELKNTEKEAKKPTLSSDDSEFEDIQKDKKNSKSKEVKKKESLKSKSRKNNLSSSDENEDSGREKDNAIERRDNISEDGEAEKSLEGEHEYNEASKSKKDESLINKKKLCDDDETFTETENCRSTDKFDDLLNSDYIEGSFEKEELKKERVISDNEVEESHVQAEKQDNSSKTNFSITKKDELEITSINENESDDEKSKYIEEPEVMVEDSSVRTKFVGLGSTSEEEMTEKNEEKKEILSNSDEEKKTVVKNKTKGKSLKKRSELNKNRSLNLVSLDSSDDEDITDSPDKKGFDEEEVYEGKKSKKGDKSPSPFNLSSADSSDSEIIISRKRKKKSSSDSDASVVEDKKKDTKKRKRVKMDDSSEESGEDKEKSKKRKSSVGESPGKGLGRKNIKKIKGKDDLADATKEAAEEEKERRRRVEERQKLFNQVFEVKEAHVLDKLVLDFDLKEKKELLSVNETLVSKMKPHQAKGVKFMWDSCFESLSEIKKTKGSGCILAHCMGLGKTFQVISLVHTLLTNEETGVHTIMVVCPLSTVLNWYNEFDKWLQDVENGSDIEVFHLTRCKQNPERARELRRWQHNGGVLIMGYEMFRNLAAETNKKFRAKMKKDFQETLIDPGADLIVCDEGHMLKNEQTALSKAMNRVKTLRRIVLTGTPMQNNLNEYHCMVQFVKPNLLGTRKEFLNRFVNPITNGQFVDSTDADVKVMKRRAHVLHKMLEGLVQRFDYNVLTPFLPPKHEYVISICLSELQIKLYQHYLQHYSQQSENNKGGARLFQDWQALGRMWTHPRVLKLSSDKANWLREKKALEESDSEGSLRDFIDDGSDAETTSDDSDNSSFNSDKSVDGGKKKNIKSRNKANTRSTRSNPKNIALLESSDDEKDKKDEDIPEAAATHGEWWSEFIEPHHLEDMNLSGKLVMLFGILKESEMIEDKVLVFSQSLFSLDLIEYFLDKIDSATQEGRLIENLCNHQGNWSKGLDYFRLDGSTSSENRSIWCKAFNREDNPRARLFLISTRAGGLGINLTAANRVIIFDASWNPSHDVQSIFRIYRFGQKKPCYVYRFIAHGTMEEKVYDRQVAKQSMSNRVVDEQQVHRHFSSNDLNELYSFTPPTKKEDRPIPALPKDVLFAEILKEFSDWVEKYHEHDSLLENVIEEELNAEERQLAWEDYENDKKRGFMPTPASTGGGNVNPLTYQIEYLRQQLKAQYPDKSEKDLNQILVYQVSLLMRQQQIATQMQQIQQQNMSMGGNVRMPMAQGSMAQGSMSPFGMMQQKSQQNAIADYQKQMQAQYQLRQMQLQQQQNAMRAQFPQQQSMLRSQLSAPSTANRPASMPTFALERMLQNYQAPNPNSSTTTATSSKTSSSSNPPS